MERRSVQIFVLLALWPAGDLAWAAPPTPRPTPPVLDAVADATELQISRLIEQLGDDRFIVRQRAERELLAIGNGAFDQLKAAEDFPDPEVAARARFLARRLTVDWVRPGDPPLVRELMERYGSLEEADRQATVDALAARAEGGSVSALCRIVRFDASDFVSRYAALAIARQAAEGQATMEERYERIRDGLGRSQRTAADWLRTYLVEPTDPEAALRAWRLHTVQQRSMVNQHTAELSIGLLRQQARILDRLGRDAEMVDRWFEMFAMDPNDERGLLAELIVLLIEKKRFEAIDRVVASHRDRFRTRPSLLYLVAEAHLEQGEEEKARQSADDAFALAGDPQLRLQVGHQLMRRGRFEWSEREYREVIDKMPVTAVEAIYARSLLASTLYDHERYQDAADLFAGLLKKAEGDKAARGALDTVPNMDIQRLAARHEYYTACHHRSLDNRVQERRHLDKAIQYDPTDIDVLIAMYALPDADETYRKQTRARIDTAAKMLDRQIRRNPEEAVGYNNWAWLVANTFGDYALAVERARQAVELADEDSLAGHLDTLARCYFAAGDVESALEQQQKAVALDPHTRQLRRQLEVFKKGRDEGAQAIPAR